MFLGRALKAPQVKRVEPATKSKFANFIRIIHRDEVEAPITDWLEEAYEWAEKKKTATKNANVKRRKRDARVLYSFFALRFSFSTCQLRARRRVGLEIAEHELDSAEHQLHQVRHHVELRPVPEHAVEDAPFAFALDPRHAEIVVGTKVLPLLAGRVLSASTLSSTCSFSRVYGPVIGK